MIWHTGHLRGAMLVALGLLAPGTTSVQAGGLFHRRDRVAVPTVRTAPVATARTIVPGPAPAPLGTFTPMPFVIVRGNFPVGGGYSPNNSYGYTSMDIYGPLSAYRSNTAPVTTYGRGYDGRVVPLEGNGFSTPNLPSLSPVVYPTQGNYYYGFPQSEDPPWWKKGSEWIDQN